MEQSYHILSQKYAILGERSRYQSPVTQMFASGFLPFSALGLPWLGGDLPIFNSKRGENYHSHATNIREYFLGSWNMFGSPKKCLVDLGALLGD
jgi:hypothetical protein